MNILINKYKKPIQFVLINCIFLFMILLCNMQSIKYVWVPIVFVYLVYACRLSEINGIYNQIVLLCLTTLFYDNLWKWIPRLNVPLSIKYVVDILSIILLFKILINFKKYKNIFKDKIIFIIILFIGISIIGALDKKIELINYIMSIRIYLRFIPVYIILSNLECRFKKEDLIILIVLNIIPLPIFAIKAHQDDFSGVFGISNVQVFFLFILIIYILIISIALNKKIKSKYVVISTILTFILLGLGEIKIGFIIIPIVCLIIVCINKKRMIFTIKLILSTMIMMLIGLNILVKVSPDFIDFFNPKMFKTNVINYVMKSSNPGVQLGRIENIVYTHNNILTDTSKKYYGLGVGSSMPSENWYYESHSDGRKVISLYETDMYKKYGSGFGYHFSSMNIIYLETGALGICIFYILMIIILIRAFKVIKNSDILFNKCVGNITIAITVALIPLMYYYWYLLDRSAVYMFIFIVGLMSKKYMDYKKR